MNVNERMMLSKIESDLCAHYTHSVDFCFLFVGYTCNGRQYDATLIKSNAIINLELKNYSGEKIVADSQGNLTVMPNQRRLNSERSENPVEQVSQQNYALRNFILKNHATIIGGYIGAGFNLDIAGYIVVNTMKELDDSKISAKKAWLRITDLARAFSDIQSYHGRDFTGIGEEMLLSEDVPVRLANLLDLKEIHAGEILQPSIDHRFDDYLRDLARKFHDPRYIHRPEIEFGLLGDKNIILTGSPGSGKSSMVKAIARYRANEILQKPTKIKCPVLLDKLRGDENITDLLPSIFDGVIETEEVGDYLREGRFWILFDGVDEYADLKRDFPNISRFIKRYPNNDYVLTVRREVYNNKLFKDDFAELEGFEEINVRGFTADESLQLLRYELGEQYTPEMVKSFEDCHSQLPADTPLTVKMTAAILRRSGSAIFETIGDFYEQFFAACLEWEAAKLKTSDRTVIYSLYEILTSLAKNQIKSKTNDFSEAELIKHIKKINSINTGRYLELLLKSEILTMIERGGERRVAFTHHSFVDYLRARELVGTLTSKEVVYKTLSPGLGLYYSPHPMIMLCGIEPNKSIVDLIIKSCVEWNRLDYAADFMSNTRNVSPLVITQVTNAFITKMDTDRFLLDTALEKTYQYGARFCGLKMYEAFERLALHDLVMKAKWEVVKHEKFPDERDNDSLFNDNDEGYNWSLVACILQPNIACAQLEPILFEHFWKERSHNVQFRIVHHLWWADDKTLAATFARRILREYSCGRFVDLVKIEKLTEDGLGMYDEDLSIETGCELAPGYYFKDYKDETYEILIKSHALWYLGATRDKGSEELIKSYLNHENVKLQETAKASLNRLIEF